MAEKRWKSRKTVRFSDGDVLAHAKRTNKGKGGARTIGEAPEVAPKNEKAKNGTAKRSLANNRKLRIPKTTKVYSAT